MQMQRMQLRMKLPLKHDTRYAQHFAEVYSEPCQTSEVELFMKTVNDLKPLKTAIAERSTLVFEFSVYFFLVFFNTCKFSVYFLLVFF